ncbi:MAG: hypothetical protein KAV97_02070 [Actinomycetia bacterium]|nr:hypothetical protein [Actinomycetes bacterium]
MKKNKIFITMLSIILVLLFITSCSRETLVSPEETKVVEEKTKEEVEPERPSIDYSKETHDIKYDGYIPTFLCAGEVNLIKITLKNKSSFTWPSSGKSPVRVGYHWFPKGNQPEPSWDDGGRTLIPEDVAPDESVEVIVKVKAPENIGWYILQIEALQEGVTWFQKVIEGSTYVDKCK